MVGGLLCDKSRKRNNTEPASNFTVSGKSSENLNHVGHSSYYTLPKRHEGTGGWRKSYNGEILELYSSRNIIWMIESRIMRWAGHVAVRGREEVYTGFWWGNLKGRDHFEDLGGDGRVT